MSCLVESVWTDLPPPTAWDVTKACLVFILGLTLLSANTVWIVILESKKLENVGRQLRVFLTALAVNGAVSGFCLAFFDAPATLALCWPFGFDLCRFEVR